MFFFFASFTVKEEGEANSTPYTNTSSDYTATTMVLRVASKCSYGQCETKFHVSVSIAAICIRPIQVMAFAIGHPRRVPRFVLRPVWPAQKGSIGCRV